MRWFTNMLRIMFGLPRRSSSDDLAAGRLTKRSDHKRRKQERRDG